MAVPKSNASPILKTDDNYQIEENFNYSPGEGNCYLMHREFGVAIGGVDKNILTGTWEASIDCPPDPDTGSDSQILFCGDRNEALEILWENRHEAYTG